MSKLVDVLFYALIGSLFIQIAVFQSESSKNTLLLYHVLVALLFALTIRLRPTIRITPDTLFLTVLTVTSLLGWAVYGISIRAVLLPLTIMAFAVGNRWHDRTTETTRLTVYQWLFVSVVAAIMIRNLLYYESLGAIYSRVRTESPVFFLASGGRNLESTQLGLLSTLLIGTVAYGPAIFVAAATSLLMMSRAGIIAVLVSMLLWLIHGKFGRWKLYLGSLFLTGGIFVCLLSFEGSFEIPILNRFDLSNEAALAADDEGRLAVWRAAANVLKSQPFGHGAGNGFTALNEQIGGHLRENNAHNILVEYAMDGGIQSSLLFVVVVLSILKFPLMIHQPSHRFAIAYAVLGMVQFTGYDAIGWFFIGVSHASRFGPQKN